MKAINANAHMGGQFGGVGMDAHLVILYKSLDILSKRKAADVDRPEMSLAKFISEF